MLDFLRGFAGCEAIWTHLSKQQAQKHAHCTLTHTLQQQAQLRDTVALVSTDQEVKELQKLECLVPAVTQDAR